MESGGYIKITAEAKNGEIVFKVSDNGKGYDTESSKDNTKGSGVGQNNVDKRIKLYYGNEYGLRIESISGQGTTVILHLGSQIKK